MQLVFADAVGLELGWSWNETQRTSLLGPFGAGVARFSVLREEGDLARFALDLLIMNQLFFFPKATCHAAEGAGSLNYLVTVFPGRGSATLAEARLII